MPVHNEAVARSSDQTAGSHDNEELPESLAATDAEVAAEVGVTLRLPRRLVEDCDRLAAQAPFAGREDLLRDALVEVWRRGRWPCADDQGHLVSASQEARPEGRAATAMS